jgi:hydroxymethylbilane synthase
VPKTIRIGTRASRLALWQAERVRDATQARTPGSAFEIVPIRSSGDQRQGTSIADLGAVGIFTREIENALLEGRAEIAVHSLKDLPTEFPDGLRLAALLPRDDPRDVLIAGALYGMDPDDARLAISALPRAATVGTSSLRRRAELLRARPDLQIVELRGNVPTRLARVESGEIDAVVLSAAGLDRLGLQPPGAVRMPPSIMMPAPAQGTIAVQARADDTETLDVVGRVDDADTRLTTDAERKVLHALHGGCRIPLGVLATVEGDTLQLRARLLTPDGTTVLEFGDRAPSANADALAQRVAEELLERGARRILDDLRSAP